MNIVADLWFDGDRFRREPVTIHIAGETIAAITPRAAAGPHPDDGPDVIDARGRLVMPGLIDVHAHIARAGFFEADEPPLQVAQIVMNFQGALRAGVTTVADMGSTIPMHARLCKLTAGDPLAGPRFLGAGPMLTASGGYPFIWMSQLWHHAGVALAVDDETSAARAVGRTVAGGMDHVKIAVMHESFTRATLPTLTVRAARAVVREAHTLGRKVFAHAHSNRDYEVALDAGVDALMHSSFDPLTPALVQRIADAGIAVNPTLWAYDGSCQVGACRIHQRPELQKNASRNLRRSWSRFADAYRASGETFPSFSVLSGVKKTEAEAAMRVAAANLRLLHDANVPIVFGNDASFGVALLSRPFDELEAMHRTGLDVPACLRSATGLAADLFGATHLGRLRVGAAADLVIASAHLEHDLAALDVDLPGNRLDVIVRGRLVPSVTSPARVAKIAAAYLEGTATTLGRTLQSWVRARFREGVSSHRPARVQPARSSDASPHTRPRCR